MTQVFVADVAGIQGILGVPLHKENQRIVDVGRWILTCKVKTWVLCHLPSLEGMK